MSFAAAIERSTNLHELEAIVAKGKDTFIEVGLALARIRDGRLWSATHASWEQYCRQRWGWTTRRANQIAQGANLAADLAAGGTIVPHESHARELARVEPDHRGLVLVEAQRIADSDGRRQTTARDIAAAASGVVRDPADVIAEIRADAPAAAQLGFGMPGTPSRELSQWDTRPETAQWLVRWAGVKPGDSVLEPSAGKGHIARALRDAGASVKCVELDATRADALHASGFSTVACVDFLDYAARASEREHVDVAVMNPPYENGADLAHILAALTLAPRVVVLARLVLLEGQERRAQLWDKHTLTRLCVLSERESFEGDTDGTPRSAFAAFEITRGPGVSCVGWR